MLMQIPFLLRESVRGWWHHRASTWPVLLTVFFASFLLMCSATFWAASRWGISQDSPLGELRLFVKAEIPDSALGHLQLGPLSNAFEQVHVISKDSAKKEFEQRFGAESFQGVDSNPLPASLALRLKQNQIQSDSIARILGQIRSLPFADGSSDPLPLLTQMEKRQNHLLLTVSAVASVVLIALWMILSNAVRLSLISRQVLVENLHTLGASMSFILLPFAFESLGQTLLATSLGLGLGLGLCRVSLDFLQMQLPLSLYLWTWLLVQVLTLSLSLAVTWRTLKGFLRPRETLE